MTPRPKIESLKSIAERGVRMEIPQAADMLALCSYTQELEDAVTEAGVILSGVVLTEPGCDPIDTVKHAMRLLGKIMSDPVILKRQGI